MRNQLLHLCFHNAAHLRRIVHGCRVVAVFAFIQDLIAAVRIEFDVQIVVDVLDRLTVVQARRRQVAVVVDAALADHRDHVVPAVRPEEADRRFAREPAPSVRLDDPGLVGDGDDLFRRGFQHKALAPGAVQGTIVLEALDIDQGSFFRQHSPAPFPDALAVF